MKGRLARFRAPAVAFVCALCLAGATAPPAEALNPVKPVCGIAGLFSGILGKACTVVQNGGRLVKAGHKLLTGNVGGAVKAVVGGSKAASTATSALGLAAIGAWVLGGAKVALHETVSVLGKTTTPQLRSTWFSSTYWRMAGIAAVLTLPFLFAASIQALMRSDLALLVRSVFGYLPLSMLAISVAAPVTMLLLAASDELSAAVSSAAGNAAVHYLGRASDIIGGLTVIAGSPFLAFLIGVLLVAGALTLWVELLMREAAVYVIVLMLPLVFAAFVWPARRIWAIRAVELLVALILSKFAIVAVLSLGGAALSSGLGAGITGWIAGIVLLMMGAFAPWALLRLVALSELASSAAGPLRGELRASDAGLVPAQGYAGAAHDWAALKTTEMRRDADRTAAAEASDDPGGPADGAPGDLRPVAGSPNGRSADAGESLDGDGSLDRDGSLNGEGALDTVAEDESVVAEAPGGGPAGSAEAATDDAADTAGADDAGDRAGVTVAAASSEAIASNGAAVGPVPHTEAGDREGRTQRRTASDDAHQAEYDVPRVVLGLDEFPPNFGVLGPYVLGGDSDGSDDAKPQRTELERPDPPRGQRHPDDADPSPPSPEPEEGRL
jgi:hypothetical protein